tara:strand:- start:1880 stop:2053 length:174 start_codon:yes stop_codon:yes gene_type:complete
MSITQFFKNVWERHEIAQQKRANFRILQMMSDKDLKDIGISRGDIRRVVYAKKEKYS